MQEADPTRGERLNATARDGERGAGEAVPGNDDSARQRADVAGPEADAPEPEQADDGWVGV